eukprot:Skav215374  [mRNA]  locus=scaffold1391:916296:917300:- [translate_table: standard]
MVGIRQLWFESYTLVLSDLEAKTKKTPHDIPRVLPLAERLVRIEQQKKRLTGVLIDQWTEPAHALVDRAHSMLEDGVLLYLEPTKCISRFDEIHAAKSDQQITFDSNGTLKVTKKASELHCDATGELRLKQALLRRSLAFDQVGLCSYEIMEAWHAMMFQATMRQPPAGHRFVSVSQVLNADRELWAYASQDSRGELKAAVGSDPPLDAIFKRLSTSPQVQCYMTPLPTSNKEPAKQSSASSPQSSKPAQNNSPKKTQQNKQFTKKKSDVFSVKELLAALPKDCISKTENGKFICLHYNNGTCRKQKASSCNMGLHICYHKGCGKRRPYIECSH